MSDEGGRIHVRAPRFSPVPEWLLDHEVAGVSANAVRLYGLLLRYGNDTGKRIPSNATLARRMGVGRATVKRAKAELIEVGAVEVIPRPGMSNDYLIEDRMPEKLATRLTSEPTRKRRTRLTSEPTPGSPVSHDRKHLTESSTTTDTRARAREVLRIFNDVFETRYSSVKYLSMIESQIEAHPDVVLEEHETMLRTQASLSKPWWTGTASPPLFYANDAAFERALSAKAQRANGNGRRQSYGLQRRDYGF